MIAMVEEHGMKFFLRDADNILNAECVILIGTREQAQGLNCGHCGFTTCAGRMEGVPLRIEQHRCRYRNRFRVRHSSRYARRHTRHVLCRIGSTTPELAERLQNGYGNSCKCILQESVFDRKPKQETKA